MPPVTNFGSNATGQKVAFPKAQGYNLSIDGKWYRTVAGGKAQMTIGSKDSLAQRQDRSGSTYENVLDIGYAWARSDLSGGEGLDWDPRTLAIEQDQAALDQMRYFDSNGINVARPKKNGEQYRLRLSRSLKEWDYAPVDPKDLSVSSSWLYLLDDDSVHRFGSWGNATPADSWVVDAGISMFAIAVSQSDTAMVTSDDGDAYVKGPLDASFKKFYSDSSSKKKRARGAWFVHGRFIMSTWDDTDNAILYEVNWDSAVGEWKEEKFDTASSPFWSVVESGPAVVSACGDGTVRTYTPDNGQGGTYELLPRGRTTMPEGEQPILLGANAGVLLVMTTSNTDILVGQERLQVIRLYQAEVLDDRFDYIAGQLQLRRTWTAATHEGLETRSMISTRDEIFWFVREADVGVSTQLARAPAELSESSWRFDVVTFGLNRVNTLLGRNLNAITAFDSLYAGIDFENNVIMVVDVKQYSPVGWMIFPNITFGLNTDISWLSLIVEAQNIAPVGAQVELFVSDEPEAILDWEDPSWRLVTRISSPSQTGIEVPLTSVNSKTLAVQLRMRTHADRTQAPEVTNIGVRGIPSHRDLVMLVPINVSDYVSAPGRQPMHVPHLGDRLHEQVLSLVGSNVTAQLLDPPVMFNGIVNNVSEPVEYLSDRGSVTRYILVEFRGKRVSTFSKSIGDSGIGLGLLGVSTVGIGQTRAT